MKMQKENEPFLWKFSSNYHAVIQRGCSVLRKMVHTPAAPRRVGTDSEHARVWGLPEENLLCKRTEKK